MEGKIPGVMLSLIKRGVVLALPMLALGCSIHGVVCSSANRGRLPTNIGGAL